MGGQMKYIKMAVVVGLKEEKDESGVVKRDEDGVSR